MPGGSTSGLSSLQLGKRAGSGRLVYLELLELIEDCRGEEEEEGGFPEPGFLWLRHY